MDQTAAYLLLGINQNSCSDQIENAIEEAVFSEASYFMRRAFIPKLAKARVRKLEKIASAAAQMGFFFADAKSSKIIYPEPVEPYPEDISGLLSVYYSHETKLKLKIINSENPNELMAYYVIWNNCFSDYRTKYIELFEKLSIQDLSVANVEVSQTYQLDFNELIEEIKQGIYTKTAFKEYSRLLKMNN